MGHFETSGKVYRNSEVLRSNLGLWIDTTVASGTGAPAGLEDIVGAVKRVGGADAIILNPGQAERLAESLGGLGRPAAIMRLDWTNVFRDETHPIPCNEPVYCPIALPDEALRLGASAVMATLLLGFDEAFEAANVRQAAAFAREASKENVPIAIDVRSLGPRVNEENFADTVLLGASMALEFGADMVVVPYPGEDALKTALSFVSVPIVLAIDSELDDDERTPLRSALQAGITSVLLREKLFATEALEAELERIRAIQRNSAGDTR